MQATPTHYNGPYKVLDRTEKYFTLDCDGRKDTVSLDRLKPAYLEVSPEDKDPSVRSHPTSPTPLQVSESTRTTRSGRRSFTSSLGEGVMWRPLTYTHARLLTCVHVHGTFENLRRTLYKMLCVCIESVG